PDDPGAWLVDDAYLFGSDILVAPLFHARTSGREVYLPHGKWIDYQTNKVYEGGWHHITAGEIPAVILVRDGAVIPHMAPALSTDDLDWSRIDLITYSAGAPRLEGFFCHPADNRLVPLTLTRSGGGFRLSADPAPGKVRWQIIPASRRPR
ncbi:MAG TPA: glycoside hydrolase family 31 protein, partial [Prolixibacteraceae bacterium]|nr:glycoside hydrolase family 31 protein [Prolixibacteraceae bacterium]